MSPALYCRQAPSTEPNVGQQTSNLYKWWGDDALCKVRSNDHPLFISSAIECLSPISISSLRT